MKGGCINGGWGAVVYYSQTTSLMDNHGDEVEDVLAELGFDSITFKPSEESLCNFINTLVWAAIDGWVNRNMDEVVCHVNDNLGDE